MENNETKFTKIERETLTALGYTNEYLDLYERALVKFSGIVSPTGLFRRLMKCESPSDGQQLEDLNNKFSRLRTNN